MVAKRQTARYCIGRRYHRNVCVENPSRLRTACLELHQPQHAARLVPRNLSHRTADRASATPGDSSARLACQCRASLQENRKRNRIHDPQNNRLRNSDSHLTYRTHSCVPRRDSSRRLVDIFSNINRTTRCRDESRHGTHECVRYVRHRKVTSFKCGVALKVSSEMRSRVNKNSVSEQLRIRQFTSIATASGACSTVCTAIPIGPPDVN